MTVALPDLYYLASPYTNPDPAVRQVRFQAACEATAHLMRQRMHVFSPVVHSHPLAAYLPAGWDFWRPVDLHFLGLCQRFIVLMLPGWRESVGVGDEIRAWTATGRAVEHMSWPPEQESDWP